MVNMNNGCAYPQLREVFDDGFAIVLGLAAATCLHHPLAEQLRLCDDG